MAISDTITSMYENVGEVYDTITNVSLPEHKNIENIPSTIRDSYLEIMNNGIDVVWNNWEKVVGEGTELTLSNTEKAPMKVLLKGNTYQDSTTGKNLLNIPDGTYTDNDNLITAVASNGEITINGTTGSSYAIVYIRNVNISVSASYYSLSINNSATNNNIIIRFDSNVMPTQLNAVNKTNLKNFDSSQTLTNFAIRVAENTTLTNFKIKPQFEAGQSATSWEPYTNGPSPNPDYPQEVHVVSGDNTVEISNGDNTQSTTYPINLPEGMELCKIGDYKDRFFKTSGKNLFSGWTKGKSISSVNGSIVDNTDGAISDYIPVNFTENTNYYVSGLTDKLHSFIGAYNSNKQFLGRTGASARLGTSLSSSSFSSGTPQGTGDIAYIIVCQYVLSGVSTGTINDVDNLQTQVEVGNTPTSYEPYGSNEWYLEKKIGKHTFDGVNNQISSVASQNNIYVGIYSKTNEFLVQQTPISNYYKGGSPVVIAGRVYVVTAGNLVMCDTGSSLTTKALWNAWLKDKYDNGNPVEIYYVLNTPTYTKIEGTLASQLEEVYRAKSEEGQTNISQTNNDLPFVLDVSALKKLI